MLLNPVAAVTQSVVVNPSPADEQRRLEADGAQIQKRIEELGLMPAKPVRQRQVIVEEMNGCREYFQYKERCIFCDIIDQELMIGKRVGIKVLRREVAADPDEAARREPAPDTADALRSAKETYARARFQDAGPQGSNDAAIFGAVVGSSRRCSAAISGE